MSDYPSIGQQAKNLIQSVGNVVKNPYIVSDEVKQERLNICSLCEHHDYVMNRCRECGCFLNAKVIFAGNSCPIGKWNVVEKSVPEVNVEDTNTELMVEDRDYPVFPKGDKEVGFVYEWKGSSWTWKGEQWEFNYPEGYDGPREENV
jgi:hypothetical protein